MKRLYLLFICIIICTSPLLAGDSATFVNLGFSDDSRYFGFAQYGISSEETKPYAELYLVDVKKNAFVSGGTVSRTYDTAIQMGQDGFGAFLKLVTEKTEQLTRLNIDFLKTGRLVYILVNGTEPKTLLEFRDFEQERKFKVQLHQEQFSAGEQVSSSFFISLTATDRNGKVSTYTIGLPNYKRPGVLRYRIHKVFFSPDETSLVFVIEKETEDTGGVNIRYMVETVSIQ